MQLFFKTTKILIFGLLISQFTNCEKKPKCETATSVCGTFQTCCTSTDCYYVFNNKKYHCDGTNCEEIAKVLAEDMCNAASNRDSGAVISTEEEVLELIKIILEAKEACISCP